MRLRKANRGNRRRTQPVIPSNAEKFCYIEYTVGDILLRDSCGCGCGMVRYRGRLVDPTTIINTWEREAESYAKAIAYLTSVKLNIIDEDKPWCNRKACKIVEGYYTKANRRVVNKVTELPNERDSSKQWGNGVRQLRELKRAARQLSLRFGISFSQAMAIVSANPGGWSSGAAHSGSTASTVGRQWYEPEELSF